jgi:hypothetical protein
MATLEQRYLHQNGQVFRGRMHLTLVPDEQGRPDHFVGLLEDWSGNVRTRAGCS